MMSASRIAFLTGAGISTAAGIPDFRGPRGVWTRDPEAEKTSTLSWYLRDPDVRRRAWRTRAESAIWERSPTPAHYAIASVEKAGRLQGIITQNIDGLHQEAGSDPSLVHEVHGNAREWRCEDCGETGAMAAMIARVRAGEPDPRCPECEGITRATTILFEEMLDPDVLDAATAAAERCDLIVAVGTSLFVQPVASLFPMALDAGAIGVIVNAQPTPFDDMAEVVLSGDIQDELPRFIRSLLS
ncbi:NAD-dependent protein deacetylase [Brevibacterium daeguense]|uniref:protein acetyllysine N-acetyltransferase n=1 Tax=Brevibacterium daeguense TaxID=909936 RepID=A0ABP8EMP2_9MICO|nr:Sir2 family NAD-dependent protein deacetylase [Brevibacterium daeguense]